MAITQDAGRQNVLVAKQSFALADLVDATAVAAVSVPAGAIVVGGHLGITTAFDSGTSDTIAVGDGTTTYLTATSVAATGVTEFTTVVGPMYASADTIDITWDGTGTAATTGVGYLVVEYIIDGRATEAN